MVKSRKLLYMALGGILALSILFGAFVTFAQTDNGVDDRSPNEEQDAYETFPAAPLFGGRGSQRDLNRPANGMGESEALLAEELGITVEELRAAHDQVRTALVEQAVVDGLLTQEQADQLLSNPQSFRGHGGFMRPDVNEVNTLLADALGISVETLEAARESVKEAKMEELVAQGVITQEQLDLMQARQAVQEYVDTDAINDSLQSAYETAVEQALADEVITQAQADQMLENLPTFNGFSGRGGPRFPGGHHGHQGQKGFGPQGSPGQQGSFGSGQTPSQGNDA